MIKRSCEDRNKVYVSLGAIRLVFEDGKYVGWYRHR